MRYLSPGSPEANTDSQPQITIDIASECPPEGGEHMRKLALPYGVLLSSTDSNVTAPQPSISAGTPAEIEDYAPSYIVSIGNAKPNPYQALADAHRQIDQQNTTIKNLEHRLFAAEIDIIEAKIAHYGEAKQRRDFEYLAMHDEETGLLNRRGLFRAVEEDFANGQKPGLVIFFDITNLKRVNACDDQRHLGGDYAILRYAQAILHSIREDRDILARTGGDEMVAIIAEPEGPEELRDANLQRQLNTLRDRVGHAVEGFLQKNPDLSYTDLACGFVLFNSSESLEDLLLRADEAAATDKKIQHKRKGAYRVID